MACLNPDGTLTSSAEAILAAIQTSNRPEDIAQATGLPLYRVRSSLRELVELGLLLETSETYAVLRGGAAQNAAIR
jgi:DNA-binding IclR family transcriptional regulator